jgi:GTP-binding protein HflX
VGYTNAGKSTIFNALTGAGVPMEDKLFATLDSTSRKLELPGDNMSRGMQVLLVDTVGFIRRLPHSLVNAFRSTLEEVNHADIILNVIDASDPDAAGQYETTLSVLRDLEAEHIPMIKVLNKIDKLESPDILSVNTESVHVCAVESRAGAPRGLRELCKRIESALSLTNMCFRFPLERTDLAALVHRSGPVLSENYRDSYIEMEARVDVRTAGRLKEYQIEEISK